MVRISSNTLPTANAAMAPERGSDLSKPSRGSACRISWSSMLCVLEMQSLFKAHVADGDHLVLLKSTPEYESAQADSGSQGRKIQPVDLWTGFVILRHH